MACERPPACRFAPRLSPFVRGTLNLLLQCPPYEGGQPRSEATGRGSLTRHVAVIALQSPQSPYRGGDRASPPRQIARADALRARGFPGDRRLCPVEDGDPAD